MVKVWYRIQIDDQEEFGRGMELSEIPDAKDIPHIFERLAVAAESDFRVKHG